MVQKIQGKQITPEFPDDEFKIQGSVDATKQLAFDVDTNVVTGTTTTIIVPATGGTVPVSPTAETITLESSKSGTAINLKATAFPSGDIVMLASGSIDISNPTGSGIAINAQNTLTLSGGNGPTSISSGAALDITFDARGAAAPIPLSEVGNVDLAAAFTATSIIGSLNELKAVVGPVILSTTTSINATQVLPTVHSLYTVPVGKTAVITGAIIRSSLTVGLTIPATGGIGIATGPFAADIIADTLWGGFIGSGDIFFLSPSGGNQTAAVAGSVINLGISVAPDAGQTLTIDLLGYLV